MHRSIHTLVQDIYKIVATVFFCFMCCENGTVMGEKEWFYCHCCLCFTAHAIPLPLFSPWQLIHISLCFYFEIRARELLATPAKGGLSEKSVESELSEAEGVLDALRSSPVVYPEEEVSRSNRCLSCSFLYTTPKSKMPHFSLKKVYHPGIYS